MVEDRGYYTNYNKNQAYYKCYDSWCSVGVLVHPVLWSLNN